MCIIILIEYFLSIFCSHCFAIYLHFVPKNWSSQSLRSGEALNSSTLRHSSPLKTLNFPSQATENWSSPSLRSGESLNSSTLRHSSPLKTLNFPSQATENWSSPSLRSGEALNSSTLRSGKLIHIPISLQKTICIIIFFHHFHCPSPFFFQVLVFV
jgi:hypothetical protein